MLQITRFLAALAVAGVAITVPAVGPAGADPPRISTCIFLPEGCDEPEWEIPNIPEIPDPDFPDIEIPPCVLLPAGCLRPADPRPDDPEIPDEPETPDTPTTPDEPTMPDSPAAPQAAPDTDVQVLPATAAVAVEASPNFTG